MAIERSSDPSVHQESLFKVREVAARLRVTPKQVRKWIACGVLDAYRLPFGQWRISERAIRKLLGK